MTTIPPPQGPPLAVPPPSGALRAWGKWTTVVAVAVVIIVGGGLSTFSSEVPSGTQITSVKQVMAFTGMLAAIACGVAMVWRTRFPWLVMWGVGAAALIFPIDPIGTLIAMGWVIPTSSNRRAVVATVWGALITIVSLGRDMLRDPPYVLLSTENQVTGERTQLPVVAYIVAALLVWGIALTVGLLRRYRAESLRIRTQVAETERVAVDLRGQLDRQEERDLIAREMHDTIAHELSVISLHVSALEVGTEDENAKTTARAVRRLANRGLGELRSLIGSLRDSSVDGYVGAPRSVESLARIVDEARGVGVRVQDHIDIRGVQNLALTASSAIYRIVQESMTNAMRHAPNSPITVTVTGSPHDGITVVVASWLEEGVAASVGAGSGIRGMQERARSFGGQLRAGVEHDMWVVRANMPWHPAEDTNEATT